MRIIAGKAKGRIIKAPAGMATRPTSEKAREAIFSSLGEEVLNACVLDLYAGSGALGIEALSRGAKEAVFVDSSFKAIQVIKENLAALGFSDQAKVFKRGVEDFLEQAEQPPSFNLIFIDAPYKIGLSKLVGIVKLALQLLVENGVALVEHSAKDDIRTHIRVFKTKKYGQTTISYIK